MNGPKAPFVLPAPKLVTDEALEEIIRGVGIDRALNAGATVEATLPKTNGAANGNGHLHIR